MARSKVDGAQFGLLVSGAVVKLKVPEAANVAEVFVREGPISYTRDGTDPSRSRGHNAYAGGTIYLNSRDECNKFETSRASDIDGLVDVEYFTEPAGVLQVDRGNSLQYSSGQVGRASTSVSYETPLPVDIVGLMPLMDEIKSLLGHILEATEEISS